MKEEEEEDMWEAQLGPHLQMRHVPFPSSLKKRWILQTRSRISYAGVRARKAKVLSKVDAGHGRWLCRETILCQSIINKNNQKLCKVFCNFCMSHTGALSLLELLRREPDLVEIAWPRERVLSGLSVCSHTRAALLHAGRSPSTRLHVALSARCVGCGGAAQARSWHTEEDLAGALARFGHASVHLTIHPTPLTPIPASIFSGLYRAIRRGACAGPVSLDLSGCYWGVGDDPCQDYGPLVDEHATVKMGDDDDEEDVFQCLAYSQNLQRLTWANCMPCAEAMDLRPLAASLGTCLTHLGDVFDSFE
jgi:hypothetical protein